MPRALILNVGYDPILLALRSAAMREAGHLVTPACSLREADRSFWQGDFDLVVLCHTIPIVDREQWIAWIRDKGSLAPIVICTSEPLGPHRFSNVALEADPKKLVFRIDSLLR